MNATSRSPQAVNIASENPEEPASSDSQAAPANNASALEAPCRPINTAEERAGDRETLDPVTLVPLARQLVGRGYSVIPIVPRQKRPPITAWSQYCERVPAEEELTEWSQ